MRERERDVIKVTTQIRVLINFTRARLLENFLPYVDKKQAEKKRESKGVLHLMNLHLPFQWVSPTHILAVNKSS